MNFGVICEGTTFAAWQARCLENLSAVENCRLTLLMINSSLAGNTRHRGRFTQVAPSIVDLLLGRISLWDWYKARFVKSKSAADQPLDFHKALSHVSRLHCRTNPDGKDSVSFSAEDIDQIRKHQLDFILNLLFEIPCGEILKLPHYGVWHFCHHDIEKYRGGPPCFWEIYHRDSVTGAVLQQLSEPGRPDVIWYRGRATTNKHPFNHISWFQRALVVCSVVQYPVPWITRPPSSKSVSIVFLDALRIG